MRVFWAKMTYLKSAGMPFITYCTNWYGFGQSTLILYKSHLVRACRVRHHHDCMTFPNSNLSTFWHKTVNFFLHSLLNKEKLRVEYPGWGTSIHIFFQSNHPALDIFFPCFPWMLVVYTSNTWCTKPWRSPESQKEKHSLY